MSEQEILITREDSSAIVSINRPGVYNALTKEAKLALTEQFRALEVDDRVRVIILTAEGKAFCTGQDLNDRSIQAGQQAVDLGHTLETEWNPLVKSIRNNKKIVIAAVNGVAAGAGVSVALACDLIVAAPSVRFISGFSKIGLCPDAGSSYIFARTIGYHRTMEFFLTNRPMEADELRRYGLVTAVEPEPLETAKTIANQLAQLPPLSLVAIKENVRAAWETDYAQSMANETAAQRRLGNSRDYQEDLRAFLEKRQAHFKGI